LSDCGFYLMQQDVANMNCSWYFDIEPGNDELRKSYSKLINAALLVFAS
jgi:hypothetical protein